MIIEAAYFLIKNISHEKRLKIKMKKILYCISDGYEWEKSKDVWDLIRWLEQNRSFKKFIFIPQTMPPFLYGAWLTSDSKEYIFYDSQALPGHKEHIILHEVCHILLNHKTKYITEEEGFFFVQQSSTCPQVVEFLLTLATNRNASKIFDKQEQEAELLAQLIQQKTQKIFISPSQDDSYLESLNLY